MNTATYLSKSLKLNGIDTVFGIPAYTFMAGLKAFKNEGLELILNAHEQNAAHMAEGYYYAMRKPAVLSVAPGPGVTNSITGIANAFTERVPMLIVIPAPYSSKQGRNEYHSTTGIDQNIDEYTILKSVTKNVFRVTHENNVISIIDLAIRNLLTGIPGPVALIFPPEFQKVEISGIEPLAVSLPNFVTAINIEQKRVLTEIWNKSQNPLFILGKNVRNVNKNSLEELLTKSCMYISSYASKGYVPKLENHIGTLWYSNIEHIRKALKSSDLIISIGEEFTDFTVRSVESIIREKDFIEINSDLVEIGKVFKHGIKISSSESLAIDFLISLERKGVKNLCQKDEAVSLTQHFIRKLSSVIPSDSAFFADVGNAGYVSITELELSESQEFYTTGKFGSCGWSIGSSIGFSHASSKPTFSIVGDLSLNMNIQELANINKLKANANILLFNNFTPQNISQDQLEEYDDEFQTDMPDINWGKIAEGYGLVYVKVLKNTDIEMLSQLDWSRAHLIEFVIPKDDRPLRN